MNNLWLKSMLWLWLLVLVAAAPLQAQPATSTTVAALAQPKLELTIVNPDEKITVLPALMPGRSYPEVPPWALKIEDRVKYFISTGWTYSGNLVAGKSLLRDADALDLKTIYRSTASNIFEEDRPQPELMNPITWWRRNYYGVFSAHLLNHPQSKEKCVVAIMQSENKNERINPEQYYMNTILPLRNYTSAEFSGYQDQSAKYVDHWETYFAFVGLTYCPVKDMDGARLMGYDQGPILWPSSGYLDAQNQIICRGLRHPTSLVHDNYLYIYYLEEFPGLKEEGRMPGIKVARAPVASMGLPGSFMSYYNGTFNEPSLPAGFNRLKRDFFNKPGGRSTPLFADYALRFSVAKVNGMPYFLGVEEKMIKEDQFEILLRLSTDLVNWSDGVSVPGTQLSWRDGFHYPILANSDLTCNDAVDANDFYLMGSQEVEDPGGRKVRVAVRHLSIEIRAK